MGNMHIIAGLGVCGPDLSRLVLMIRFQLVIGLMPFLMYPAKRGSFAGCGVALCRSNIFFRISRRRIGSFLLGENGSAASVLAGIVSRSAFRVEQCRQERERSAEAGRRRKNPAGR